jgi:hypothetical protein
MATTLSKEDKKSILGSILRKGGEPLAQLDIKDIIEEFDIIDFELREGNDGGEYLRLIADNEEGWVNISLGKSVELMKKGEARINELVNNYTIYCGWNDKAGNRRERPWLSFGSAGDTGAKVIGKMSVKKFMAA